MAGQAGQQYEDHAQKIIENYEMNVLMVRFLAISRPILAQ